MTYEDALKVKNSEKPNPFLKNGIEYIWMVVPKTEEYFSKYAEDNLNNPSIAFSDEDSKDYAKDGLFKLFGVKMKR